MDIISLLFQVDVVVEKFIIRRKKNIPPLPEEIKGKGGEGTAAAAPPSFHQTVAHFSQCAPIRLCQPA